MVMLPGFYSSGGFSFWLVSVVLVASPAQLHSTAVASPTEHFTFLLACSACYDLCSLRHNTAVCCQSRILTVRCQTFTDEIKNSPRIQDLDLHLMDDGSKLQLVLQTLL